MGGGGLVCGRERGLEVCVGEYGWRSDLGRGLRVGFGGRLARLTFAGF